jgi:hypothetical protein
VEENAQRQQQGRQQQEWQERQQQERQQQEQDQEEVFFDKQVASEEVNMAEELHDPCLLYVF